MEKYFEKIKDQGLYRQSIRTYYNNRYIETSSEKFSTYEEHFTTFLVDRPIETDSDHRILKILYFMIIRYTKTTACKIAYFS